jgi:hypothetical protein
MDSAVAVTSRQRRALRPNSGLPTGVRPADELFLPGLRIKFLSSEPVLMLGGETIAAAAQATNRRQLINRFFSIPSLKSLRINWRKGEVRLEFATRLSSIAEPLAELAAAMGGHPPEALSLLHEEVVLQSKGFSTFEIHRLGSSLTLWRVDMLSPRVYRLTHPLLRGDFVAYPNCPV